MTRAIQVIMVLMLLLIPPAILSQPNRITPSKDDLRYALNRATAIIEEMHELPAPEISRLASELWSVLDRESVWPLKNLHSILLMRASEAETDEEYQNDLISALDVLRIMLRVAPDRADELFQSWKSPGTSGMLSRDEAFQGFQRKFVSAKRECFLESQDPLKALEAFKASPDPNFSALLFSNLLTRLYYHGKKDLAVEAFEQEAMAMLNDPARRQQLLNVVQWCSGLLTIPPRVLDGYAKVIKTTFRSDMITCELRLNQFSLSLNPQEQQVLLPLFRMAVQDQPSGQYLLDLFPSLKEKVAGAGGLLAFREARDVDFREPAGKISRWRSSRQTEKDFIQRLGKTASHNQESVNQVLMSDFGKRDDFDRVLYIASESKYEFPALSSVAWGEARAVVLRQQSQDQRASMTWDLLESYVKANGTLDKRMVRFALDILQPRAPAKNLDPNDRFNPQTPAGLEIYIIGEWAAVDFADAAAYVEVIPEDLLRLSAWIEMAAAYDRRVTRLRFGN